MNYANRPYTNTAAKCAHGVLALPGHEPYFARLVHATWGNVSQALRGTRGAHTHDVYHLVLTTAGHGSFLVGGRTLRADAGTLFVVWPGVPHSFANAEGENNVYCEVTFEFLNRRGRPLTIPFHEALSLWSGQANPEIAHTEVPPDVHASFTRQVEEMVQTGFAGAADAQLLLLHGLSRIFLLLQRRVFRPGLSSRHDPIQAAGDELQRRYNQVLTLGELAAVAGLSPNYLSRRFKQRFGQTPIYYQHRLRIEVAAQLLRTTQYPLKQVAEVVGYRDVYFFSRMFRKLQKLPPGQYRRRVAERRAPASHAL